MWKRTRNAEYLMKMLILGRVELQQPPQARSYYLNQRRVIIVLLRARRDSPTLAHYFIDCGEGVGSVSYPGPSDEIVIADLLLTMSGVEI
ncbi:hypothetical protein SBOR_4891 [Sclerotinia borealis F-4128]|uniref:Uncharacterized protein n=1 Tax=Sclerotinia borealis (strain F-4128) TaxID=1432307 RepID=W9CJ69_SCLBF|nr:hypothetical protein SBOR_4891 [Sclerotinia borealis F-4128]